MIRKKLTLSFELLLVVALALGAVCPCVIVGENAVNAFAETYSAVSSADWTPTYNGSYYDNVNESLTGTALRSELANLITRTHNTSANSYDNLKTQFMKTDVDPATGKGLLWFYSGTKVSSYDGSPSNREHVWPKDGGDAFPEKTGPGCDLQHLRPTDSSLNSTRGSLSFDEFQGGSVVAENKSTSYGNLCYRKDSFFYPGKGYRGATARILFYVQTRWGDQYNLSFVDGKGNCKTIGKISTLLKWHLEEPPTASEIYRNQKAFEIQGNRNPFIDHPEYASAIYCNDGQSYNNALKNVVNTYGDYNDDRPDLESLSIVPNALTLEIGASQTLTVQGTPSNANATVNWSSSNASVATVSNGVVRAVAGGTATITATSVKNSNIKASATVTVKMPKQATAIEVSGTPSVLQYQAGQSFNPAGLTVKVTYDDGTNASFTSSNDLKQFDWVDSASGQALLTEATKAIKCKLGSLSFVCTFTVTVTPPPEQIKGFVDSVSAIGSQSTLQLRFEAIKTAIQAYGQLTSDEKSNASAQGAYQALLNEMASYNAEVERNNNAMSSALQTGASAICGVSLALIAVLGALSRKFY